jgi:hypothetical protein
LLGGVGRLVSFCPPGQKPATIQVVASRSGSIFFGTMLAQSQGIAILLLSTVHCWKYRQDTNARASVAKLNQNSYSRAFVAF